MRRSLSSATGLVAAFLLAWCLPLGGQSSIRTPLPEKVAALIANEVSGQMAFNNQVRLSGAPWLRDPREFSDTLFETRTVADLVKGYGIETSRIERYPSTRQVEYPSAGELWVTEPDRRLVARLGADAALVAGGSQTADVTGALVYVPPVAIDEVKKIVSSGPAGQFKGKIALMWSHPREEVARVLDEAGIQAVIAYASRDRYLDPNEVIYSSGAYARNANLKCGMTVSWRQWSEFFEDITAGRAVTLRAWVKIDTYPDKFEAIYSWIPGAEPSAKGVIFTAHLFEGYVKRGANDNMSGVVVQLEILRALSALIARGDLPKPRRNIYFLWPNEISGTYEFIKRHPGVAATLSVNLNMDMVGEGLRRNNSAFTMSETPDALPSYVDGLADAVMRYVWRMNDVVYLPDAPRSRPGGQFFPMPIWEKNGSTDAFRYYSHRATGGSDHICFNNPSVGVPGIEWFTWPDQWYHADTDSPDKGDPTEMRRVAFIGAATAWTAANCTDEVLPSLIDVTSAFGYRRIAERDLPRALGYVESADAKSLAQAIDKAIITVDWAVDREIGALSSIGDIHTRSATAQMMLGNRLEQWQLYRAAIKSQVTGYARLRNAQFPRKGPTSASSDPLERKYEHVVPAIDQSVIGQEFSLGANATFQEIIKARPDALKQLGLTQPTANTILQYVNGQRSIVTIRNAVVAETGQDVPLSAVAGYLDLLKSAKWVNF